MAEAPVLAGLAVRSHRGVYRVWFDRPFAGLEDGIGEREHLLVDSRVADLYAGPLGEALSGASVLRLEATEATKSLEALPPIVTHLLAQGVRRDHVLVAVGGGIVQDVAAFLAATVCRGIAWRYYPTTLLAQADSCIGSKSSINVGGYKNQLGTFTPPDEVVISTEVLDTLDAVDLRSGIGEMIKVHVIAGWEDVRALAADYPRLSQDRPVLERALRRSLEIKKEKIEPDEFDRGERLVMNYGHTFGHALESATQYAIPHGIAVTIGMDMANFASLRLGFLSAAVYEELHALLASNYAGFEQVEVPEEPFLAALSRDKKNVGADVSVMLLRGPGEVFRHHLASDAAFRRICRDYLDALRKAA